jgi:hypothetical protein
MVDQLVGGAQRRAREWIGGGPENLWAKLARALAANGRDALTLLLTSTAAGREKVVGEARVALSVPTGARTGCWLSQPPGG